MGINVGSLTGTSTDTLKTQGKKVSYDDIQVGDMVFFDTYKQDGHVGIYIGNGKFIGAQSSTGVAEADMTSGYWKGKFSGHVRRVNGANAALGKSNSSTNNSLAVMNRDAETPSPSTSSNNFTIGSSGDVVEQIQKKVGTYADGKYGKNTANAVKAYQKKKGLKADGVVGPETLKAMGIKVSATPDSNSLAVMNRNNEQPKANGNYSSSYTNNHKTQKEALKAANYPTYKSQLSQAVSSGAVPMNAVQALTELIGRESTWTPTANNGGSTAYGYGQFLDKTVANYKKKYPQYNYDNPVHQIILTYLYATERYGSVEKALIEWDKKGWY